jgi:hypothetical protein
VPNILLIFAGYFALAVLMVLLYHFVELEGSVLKKGLILGIFVALFAFFPYNLILHSAYNFEEAALVYDTVANLVEEGVAGIVMVYLLETDKF